MRKRLSLTIATLAAAASLGACRGHASLINTPLTWNPSDDIGDLHQVLGEVHYAYGWGTTAQATGPDMSGQVADAFAGQQLQLMPLVDNRTVKDIGSNTQDAPPRPVMTQDNVADFVTTHISEILKACRVPVVNSGGSRILKGELNEFFVHEDNKYAGSTIIHFVLTDAAGHEIWSGTIRGSQDKWGRSFEAENYTENLSDATVRAVHQLLMDPGFLAAAHKGSK